MDNKQKKFFLLALLLIGCSCTSIFSDYFASSDESEKLIPYKHNTHDISNHKSSLIMIYVNGAVKAPGLYELPAGARALQAIEAAGGVAENANLEKVNLARKLKDGCHVNVPYQKTAIIKSVVRKEKNFNNNISDNHQKININTASAKELESLSGIGKATAQKIIEYRQKRKFNKNEDLLQVKGIGKSKFDKIKNEITIN